MRFSSLFIFLFMVMHLEAAFIVPLKSQATRVDPLYMHRMDEKEEGATCDAILRRNFERSGAISLLPVMQEAEEMLASHHPFMASAWRACGARHVVRVIKVPGGFHSELFDVAKGRIVTLDTKDIGNLLSTLHALSDQILYTLTGHRGSSGTEILYALRKKDRERGWISELWALDYDSGESKQLTHDNGYAICPIGGQSKEDIIYVDYREGHSKLYVLDRLTGRRWALFPGLVGNQLLPALSPSGRQIAFIADPQGSADLFISSFSSGGVGPPYALYSAPPSTQASPSFHPDESRLVFISNKAGNPQLHTLDLIREGGKGKNLPVKITRKYREAITPHWSPDGQRIAYSAKVNGVRQIMLYDLIKKEERILTEGAMHKENPCWSPNGRHLVYNTVEGEGGNLFILHPETKQQFQVTFGGERKHYPYWRRI
ncbi:MAG: hypothetical protein VXZ72_01260 [Chlamydiota bacterium]|nr:hypothetical protein [Chlamydiota bacterium]